MKVLCRVARRLWFANNVTPPGGSPPTPISRTDFGTTAANYPRRSEAADAVEAFAIHRGKPSPLQFSEDGLAQSRVVVFIMGHGLGA
jgi:hypothetical protein